MKFTAKRLLAAGAIAVSAIVTPLALTTALSGVSGVPGVASSVAGAQGPFDELTFNQSATGADSFGYAPLSGNSMSQPANISGTCASAVGTPQPAAFLSVCGEVWPLGYTGSPKLASLGTQGDATGVGAISPAWTIDSKSNKGSEAIDFSPGGSSVIGSNRAFTDAQIPVQRKDTGNSGIGTVTVQLAEFSSLPTAAGFAASLLATQNCTIVGNTGTLITADPDTCGTSTGPDGVSPVATPTSFQTIEVRDTTPSTSISVVGPTATFDMDSTVCSGAAVTSTPAGGSAVAVLALPAVGPNQTPVCKSFTSFVSTDDSGQQGVAFNGFSTGNVQFTVQITWPAVDLCSPYADPPGSVNTGLGENGGITDANGVVGGVAPSGNSAGDMCPVHSFSFDGSKFYDQAYCQSATAPGTGVEPQQELCTATKSYNNDTVVDNVVGGVVKSISVTPITNPADGKPGTQIVETWVGDIDTFWH